MNFDQRDTIGFRAAQLSRLIAQRLRDALAPLGVTTMSAGSHTEPGGYTGAGTNDLHQTVRGRRVEIDGLESAKKAEGQFGIADERTPAEVAAMLRRQGLDPVWKDWDPAILQSSLSLATP